MRGYSSSDVARMLDLSVSQIRSYTRAGFLRPRRGPRGEYRFSFQDLVLLRTAKGLRAARIPPQKIRRALERLKGKLPTGRPLSAVQIAAQGDRIVVRDGATVWNPESGQTYFDFEVSELAEKVAPLARRAAREAFAAEESLTADEWYELGCELEAAAQQNEAREAYDRALAARSDHVESHINLGRLLHEEGDLDGAGAHYRQALDARPDDPTALFNLGVALEDLGNVDRAIEAYERAIEVDPAAADAHYNLARLHERRGDEAGAVRHYGAYRRLTRNAGPGSSTH